MESARGDSAGGAPSAGHSPERRRARSFASFMRGIFSCFCSSQASRSENEPAPQRHVVEDLSPRSVEAQGSDERDETRSGQAELGRSISVALSGERPPVRIGVELFGSGHETTEGRTIGVLASEPEHGESLRTSDLGYTSEQGHQTADCSVDFFDDVESDSIVRGQKSGSQYIICDYLGAGAFGRVHHCVRRADKKAFAIKIPTSAVWNMRQEVKAMERLHELGGCRYVVEMEEIAVQVEAEADEEDSRVGGGFELLKRGMILELCDLNLGSFLRKFAYSLPRPAVPVEFSRQLMVALDFIHSAGVMHDDLFSDNILVSFRDGCLKLADFGLSKIETYTGDLPLSIDSGSSHDSGRSSMAAYDPGNRVADFRQAGLIVLSLFQHPRGRAVILQEVEVELFERTLEAARMLEPPNEPELQTRDAASAEEYLPQIKEESTEEVREELGSEAPKPISTQHGSGSHDESQLAGDVEMRLSAESRTICEHLHELGIMAPDWLVRHCLMECCRVNEGPAISGRIVSQMEDHVAEDIRDEARVFCWTQLRPGNNDLAITLTTDF